MTYEQSAREYTDAYQRKWNIEDSVLLTAIYETHLTQLIRENRFELWEVEQDEIGTTWIEKIDSFRTIADATDAEIEYRRICRLFEDRTPDTAIREYRE